MKYLAIHTPTGRGFGLDESLQLTEEFEDARNVVCVHVRSWQQLENRWQRPNYPQWFFELPRHEFVFHEIELPRPFVVSDLEQTLFRNARQQGVVQIIDLCQNLDDHIGRVLKEKRERVEKFVNQKVS